MQAAKARQTSPQTVMRPAGELAPTPAPVKPAPPVRSDVAPSGLLLSTLFPPASEAVKDAPVPRFVRIAAAPYAESTSCVDVRRTPSDADIAALRDAFAQLSPDELVLQARQGTRLAR